MAEQFGRYELRRLLGQGGMGEVYEAYETVQERTVAVKRLLPQTADDPEFQQRFRRESRLAARLSSPHVIPIHQYGEIEGRLYIEMRFVDGPNLSQLITEEGPLCADAAVDVIEQIASALDAAHHEGLVHRDVKPSNVLLDRTVGAHDFVYLADFGITRAMGGSQTRGTAQALMGSLDYMAPEQFRGTTGPEIDIYSLGCVFFQCLTGRKPFQGADVGAVIGGHMYAEPPVPGEVRPELGSTFDAVVRQALDKEASRRFETAGALARAAGLALRVAERGAAAAGSGTPSSASTSFREPDQGARAADASESRTTTIPRETPTIVVPPSAPGSRDDDPPRIDDPPRADSPGAGDDPPSNHPSTGADGAPSAARRSLWRTDPWFAPSAWIVGVAALAALALVAGIGVLTMESAPSAAPPAAPPRPTFTATTLPPPAPEAVSVDMPTIRATWSVGNGPEAVAISADGSKAYVTGSDGANVVNVVDTASGAVSSVIRAPGPPQFIALAQDGAHAYVTLYNPQANQNDVAVLDTKAGAFTAVIPTGQKRPFGLAVSPDGSKVYVPNHDSGDVSVIDTATNSVTAQITVPPAPHWIAFSPSGRFAYAANHHAGVVTKLDTTTNTQAGTIQIGDDVAPHSIAVSPDGTRVDVVNYDAGTMTVINTSDDKVIATVLVGRNPQSVVFSRDGRHVYAVNNGTNTMNVISTATNQITATVPLGTSPWMAAVSPDGRTGYVTNKETNSVTILDLTGGPGTPVIPGAVAVPAGPSQPMAPMAGMNH